MVQDGAVEPRYASSARLARDERRQSLLDVAALLVEGGGIHDVTMDAVAERAGVSRPLVYKHFANREQMLVDLFRREAQALHDEMALSVRGAESLEGMFQELIRAALKASVERGALFAALRSAGGSLREVGRDQRERDRATARAFARRAGLELGVDSRDVATTIGLLLGLIDQVLTQFRAHPTSGHAARLEDSYMTIVAATLAALRETAGMR